MDKKTKTRVLHLLHLVAQGDILQCGRCGLSKTCPLYKNTTPKLRKRVLDINDTAYTYMIDIPVANDVDYFRNKTYCADVCIANMMATVANIIVPDFQEVRIEQ